MRWAAATVRRWLAPAFAALALLAALPALAQQAALLREGQRSLDGQRLAATWVDAGGQARIEDAARAFAAGRFQPPPPAGTIYQLGPRAALWLQLRVQRPADARQEWLLEFPMPVLDVVTVFQRTPAGWRAESAGDTLAVRSWPEAGRYPHFRLDVPPGESRDVFVRIRHTTAANFPLVLATAAHHAQHGQLEYLGLGIAFGALILLIAACFALTWVYRDRTFSWYAAYAGLTTVAVGAYTGAAAHLLWPGFGALGDAPMPMLAAAAGAAGMLFVRNLLGLRRRYQVQDRLTYGLGLLGFVLAVLPPLLPKAVTLPLIGGYLALVTVIAMSFAALAWRRGDHVAPWVVAAYLPMTASVLASFLRVFGWLPVSTGSQYAVVGAMAIEVPLLLVALFIRSRDRHGAEIRAQALTTHDALTGLLAPHLFQHQLRQVIARFKRDGDGAAIMFIDLVNHARIREVFGSAVAEQSLLRSVIKLRRVLRDVDTVSRLGEARFAVILEGASARASVTDRAARLIAGGLMPLPGLKPEVTLQFHVAALLLGERLLEAGEVEPALAGQLARMSPRTRRPIRFLEPDVPQVSQPGPDSSQFLPEEELVRSRPPLRAVP